MSGVSGLRRAVPPAAAGSQPWAAELAGSLEHLGLQVTAENVLQVRKVLLTEADRLKADLERHGREAVVRSCGGDPVSQDSAREFTPRLQAQVRQGLRYADMLAEAGHKPPS